MTDIKQITIPCLQVPDGYGWQLMRLPDDEYETKRRELVAKCYAAYDVPYDVPEAWDRGPLTAWAWLLLVVNDLDRDPDVQRPLTHWGIDFGFSSTVVRNWIWTIT
jgi:hypothetical protein